VTPISVNESAEGKPPYVSPNLPVGYTPPEGLPENPVYHCDGNEFTLKITKKTMNASKFFNYKNFSIIITVFDMGTITNSEGVAKILSWYNEIIRQNPNCYVIMTGSKFDLLPKDYNPMCDRLMVPLTKIETAGFVPCSMKTGKNLEGTLEQILTWGRVISDISRRPRCNIC